MKRSTIGRLIAMSMFALAIMMLAFAATSVAQLVEDFETAVPPALPAGWSTVIVADPGIDPVWSTRTGLGANPAFLARGGVNTAWFNSFDCPAGATARLESPVMDLTAVASPRLRFWMMIDNRFPTSLDSIYVQYSTDGGTTWTTAAGYGRTMNGSGHVVRVLDIPALATVATAKIGFLGVSKFGVNMLVDDVRLFDATGLLPVSGPKAIPVDYPTLTAAIDTLADRSVGPGGVVLLVAPGVYVEKLHLPLLPGMTVTDRVTIEAGGANFQTAGTANAGSLTGGTATPGDAVVTMSGARFYTIRNMLVTPTPASTAVEYGVWMNAGASENRLEDCHVVLNKVNTGSIGVFVSNVGATGSIAVASKNNGNLFLDMQVSNCYFGAAFRGSPSPDQDLGNTWTSTNLPTGPAEGGPVSTITNIGGGSVNFGAMNISGASGMEVSKTEIHNFSGTSTAIVAGIWVGTGSGAGNASVGLNIYGNKIYNGSHAGTGSVIASGIRTDAPSSSGRFYNNMIYDIRANSSTNAQAARGINLNSTTVSPHMEVYFNSVRLSGANTSTGGSAAMVVSAGTATTRNNIFSNFSTGTGNQYGYVKFTSATVDASSNNDIYIDTTVANYYTGQYGATNHKSLSAWQGAQAGLDVASVQELPPFVSATDLHLVAGPPSQIESGGTPIAGITTDYDADTRNVSTPDMGADEYAGVPLDLVPPTIAYTPLGTTNSVAARTLATTITDALSGVPTAGIGLPRLFWKIGVGGAYNSATAAYMGGDAYEFTLGAGVSVGDTVYYYVVAQDAAGTPNIGAFPSGGAGGFTANPPNAATPPTTPSSYRVIGAPLSGDYTVGTLLFRNATGLDIKFEKFTRRVMREVPVTAIPEATQQSKSGKSMEENLAIDLNPPTQLMEVDEDYYVPMVNGQPYEGPKFVQTENVGIYLTIADAAADFNLRGVSGPTRFLLTDPSYTEAAQIGLTGSLLGPTTAVNTLTIQPDVGVTTTVTLSSTSAAFFVGTGYVIIDGSNNGTDTRDMTIINTGVTVGGSGVVLVGAATDCVVKNIIGMANLPGQGYGILLAGSLNARVENCEVKRALIGIQAQSNTVGIVVENNDIGSTSLGEQIERSGIVMLSTSNYTVNGNRIHAVARPSGSAAAASGISVGWQGAGFISPEPGVISNNNITNVRHLGIGVSAYPAYGVSLSSNIAASDITLYNNMISDIYADGDGSTSGVDWTPNGIYIIQGGGYKIYHNSVNMTGALGYTGATNIATGALTVRAGFGVQDLDIRNNIFANTQTIPAATGTKATYAAYSAVANTQYLNIDHNLYYSAGADAAFGFLLAPVAPADLSGWQTATGQDANSDEGDPLFDTATDLHINPLSGSPASSLGTFIAAVTTDIDGDARNASTPDAGADEFTVYSSATDIGIAGLAGASRPAEIDVRGRIIPQFNQGRGVVVNSIRLQNQVKGNATASHDPSFEVIVENFGPLAAASYDLGWDIDGFAQTPVTAGPLAVGDQDTITLTWTGATVGPHTFEAYTVLAADTNSANDSTGAFAFEVFGPEVVFHEGFNAFGFPPSGWKVVNADGSTHLTAPSWFRLEASGGPDNITPHEGTAYAAALWVGAGPTDEIDDWLISPNTGTVPVPSTVDSLSFWVRHYGSAGTFPDSLEISVSLTDTALASFTTILDYIRVPGGGTWHRFSYALPDGVDRYIAFRSLIFDAVTNSNLFGLDDVRITRYTLAPTFVADPTNINFSNTVVGDTSTSSIRVYNTGTLTLNITAVASDDANFEVDPTSGVIAAGDSADFTVRFIPVSLGAKSGNIVFTHDAATSPDTVTVSGTGVSTPVSTMFLSVPPETLYATVAGKFPKPVKRPKPGKPIIMPNWANLMSEGVAQGGFAPGTVESDSAGGMVIGVSHMFLAGPNKWKPIKDSANVRAWVRITKYDFKKNIGKGFNVMQKTLNAKGQVHTGGPRGFDLFANGKPMKKQLTKLLPAKQNNVMFAELLALKFNIAMSALGKIPAGFGDLIFERTGNPFDQMSVSEISQLADSMMTYHGGYVQEDYDSLLSTVGDINRAFVGALDTLSWIQADSSFPLGKLVLAGVKDIDSVSYLKLPNPFVATVTTPSSYEVESEEEMDFEDDEEFESQPIAAKLYQNYPNPFNPTTTLSFRLREDSKVSLKVYNMLGQEVASLLNNEEMEEGVQVLQFNAADLSSGIYFYRIQAEGLEDNGFKTVETGKMVLLK